MYGYCSNGYYILQIMTSYIIMNFETISVFFGKFGGGGTLLHFWKGASDGLALIRLWDEFCSLQQENILI